MAKVYEGAVLTVNENDDQVRYLVEERGRIAYAGNALPRRYERAERVSLGSRCLVPAFADTHMNLTGYALSLASPDVSSCSGAEDVLQAVEDAARGGGEGPVLAFGAPAGPAGEGALPSRDGLDAACPGRPCLLVRHGCRSGVANSALVGLAGKALLEAPGFDADTGEASRQAFFAAVSAASQLVGSTDLAGRIQHAVDTLAAHGIGTVHAVSGLGFPGEADVTLEKHIAKSIQRGFQVKTCYRTMEMLPAMRKHMPRVGACLADALDGGFDDCTAALLEPYAGGGEGHGQVYHDVAAIDRFCTECSKANLNVRLTAHGDAAFHQAVHGLCAALDYWPRSGNRHGIAGAFLPTREGLEACLERGFQLFVQPAALRDPHLPFERLRDVLGGERAQRFLPLRTLLDSGAKVSAASFAPCSDPDPLQWMAAACNHPVPGQSLTVREALRLCTANAAWAGFDEGVRGTLEKGKAADFAVLSANPYEAGPEGLSGIEVEGLVLGGKPYENQTRRYGSIVASGLFGNGRF